MGPVAIFHEEGGGGYSLKLNESKTAITHFYFTEISLMWATPETISIKD